ncbi:MAG: DNA repair protein RecO [Fidelibacterota bacterium]
MVKNTPAFVLKINPKGETSSVLHCFSRDFGKLILIAKGARTSKSPFKGLLEPFSLLNIHFNEKAGRAYQFLANAEYVHPFRNLKKHPEAVLYGSVILEVIYKTQEDTEDQKIFELLKAVFTSIERGRPAFYAHWYFILQYLKTEGLPLDIDSCYRCSATLPPAYFNPFSGHIYCKNCCAENTSVWELQPSVLSILKGLSENTPAEMPEIPENIPEKDLINRILWNTLAARFDCCGTLSSVNVLRKVL